MRYLFKVAVAFAGTLMCLSAANLTYSKDNHPTTFLGPTLRGTYTDSFNACSAYSLAGEAGFKNFRVGGTVGWQIAGNQRLKLSAEYLWQRITYSFFTGNTDEWVQQGAIGGLYQYRFCDQCWDPTFDLRAFYSHAPSKGLSIASGFSTTTGGSLQPVSSRRRIAGSDGGGIAPGVTFRPWCGTNVGLDLNYDSVRYDNHNRSNQDARGFGGTARLSQVLNENLILNASAAIRRPFNSYEASVNWANVSFYGLWSLGLAGAYTAGKNTLPSTWNVAIIGNYFVNDTCDSACQRRTACEFTKAGCPSDFNTWTSDPAVYLPQVLAIPDEDVVCSAPPPVALSTLTLPGVTGTSTINASVAFSPSSGLTYSVVAITPAPSPANTVTINPTTGVVTAVNGTGTTQTVVVTIAARNACGATATTTLTITFQDFA